MMMDFCTTGGTNTSTTTIVYSIGRHINDDDGIVIVSSIGPDNGVLFVLVFLRAAQYSRLILLGICYGSIIFGSSLRWISLLLLLFPMMMKKKKKTETSIQIQKQH